MKAEWTNADNLTPSETTGKSMLILDTPKNCSECKLMYLQGIGESICNAVDWERRPLWCPLRPLPKKMSMRDEAEFYIGYMNGKTKYLGFNEGYNACLEDILGGE